MAVWLTGCVCVYVCGWLSGHGMSGRKEGMKEGRWVYATW